jgi:hypothetical protein
MTLMAAANQGDGRLGDSGRDDDGAVGDGHPSMKVQIGAATRGEAVGVAGCRAAGAGTPAGCWRACWPRACSRSASRIRAALNRAFPTVRARAALRMQACCGYCSEIVVGANRAPSSAREPISSFRYARARFASTVFWLINSWAATSRFFRPDAASSATRRSEAVS